MADAVRIDGLDEFVRNLKRLDADLPKALRVALNAATNIVLDYARPQIPRRTGRAARALVARSTRTSARVVEGGRRAPYMPWLDFGGRVGRNRSVVRPFIREGRFVYKALGVKRAQFTAAVESALLDAARSAGIEVD